VSVEQNTATGQRIAIVTGGSRGIGRGVVTVAADEDAVSRLFDTAETTFGGVDVVVNAAGLMTLAPLTDFDLAALDRMHRTNIRGTFVVNQQAARRARPGGAVVNFSSVVIGRILPNYTGYAASKAAVEAMTFILAHELRGRDVTVNAVAPGPTATDMFLEEPGPPTPLASRPNGSASHGTQTRSTWVTADQLSQFSVVLTAGTYLNLQELHQAGEKPQVSRSRDCRNSAPRVLVPAM
jgi:NAD(P)-dependent dehydrogenase (short-subunit alcohol dehydrogenase family)